MADAPLYYRKSWSSASKQWIITVMQGATPVKTTTLPRCGQSAAMKAGRTLLELEKIKRGLV